MYASLTRLDASVQRNEWGLVISSVYLFRLWVGYASIWYRPIQLSELYILSKVKVVGHWHHYAGRQCSRLLAAAFYLSLGCTELIRNQL